MGHKHHFLRIFRMPKSHDQIRLPVESIRWEIAPPKFTKLKCSVELHRILKDEITGDILLTDAKE